MDMTLTDHRATSNVDSFPMRFFNSCVGGRMTCFSVCGGTIFRGNEVMHADIEHSYIEKYWPAFLTISDIV
jgi:hypothetical protein